MSRDVLSGNPQLRYAVYYMLFSLVPLLPLGLCRLSGWLIGWTWFCLDGRGRQIADDNLAAIETDRTRRAFLTRRSFCRFGLSVGELFHLHRIPVELARPPRLRLTDPCKLFTDGRPLQGPQILCTGHFNWELLPALLRHRGWIDTVATISLSHEDPRVDRLFDRQRAATGMQTVGLDQAPLAILRRLRGGAVLGLVADRNYTEHGLSVAISGRQLSLPIGPAALAVQADTCIRPVFLLRNGYTRCWAFCFPPLRARPELSKNQQVRQLAADLAEVFGRVIRTAPDQWIAFHPIWQANTGRP